jgi:hypothetical protein
MPIDHREAIHRVTRYHFDAHQPYSGQRALEGIAALIDQAVKETALECALICARNADQYRVDGREAIADEVYRQAAQIWESFGVLIRESPLRQVKANA